MFVEIQMVMFYITFQNYSILVHDKTCFMYFKASVTLINVMVNSLFKLGKALCADPMMFLALKHLNLQQENIFIVFLF